MKPKLIAPDYYKNFSCIADKCAHNCCIGWEIDIDADTYDYYKTIGGKFGGELNKCISCDGGMAHFMLSKDERCPFLDDNNLCRIILKLGEDSLCQICSDHPRFRNFFDARTEIGIGMSCENAARVILTQKDKVRLELLSGDNTEEENEQYFFDFREILFSIIQNREKPLEERVCELIERCEITIPEKTAVEWYHIYNGMERLDTAWDKTLACLKHTEKKYMLFDNWDIAFEQLIVYFLYRHMADGIYDNTVRTRISFAVHAYKIIRRMCEAAAQEKDEFLVGDMIEIARMYSAEIEYSEENFNTLLNILAVGEE